MADIYQQIWDADQQHCGLGAVRPGTGIDEATRAHGYVVVDEKPEAGADHRVVVEAVIPTGKVESYRGVETLFNNYTLDQKKREVELPKESAEVQAFLDAIYATPPMEVARSYVGERVGREISRDERWAILQRVWFERFAMGANRDLSGFENVVIGEQRQGEVKGYHF